MRVRTEKKVGQWHCYRLVLDGMKPLDAMHVRNKLGEILMRNMSDAWHFGNGFSTVANLPPLPANPGMRDCFVLIWSQKDRLTFDALVNPEVPLSQA